MVFSTKTLFLHHQNDKDMKTRLLFAMALVFSAWQLKAQVTPPEPVAGKTVTKDYITQNLVYPEADLQQGNSGKVVIGMNLDAQGKATQYEIKSTFSEAAAPIALHLVKTILWKPALISGLPSDYYFEYEVDFSVCLQDNARGEVQGPVRMVLPVRRQDERRFRRGDNQSRQCDIERRQEHPVRRRPQDI